MTFASLAKSRNSRPFWMIPTISNANLCGAALWFLHDGRLQKEKSTGLCVCWPWNQPIIPARLTFGTRQRRLLLPHVRSVQNRFFKQLRLNVSKVPQSAQQCCSFRECTSDLLTDDIVQGLSSMEPLNWISMSFSPSWLRWGGAPLPVALQTTPRSSILAHVWGNASLREVAFLLQTFPVQLW